MTVYRRDGVALAAHQEGTLRHSRTRFICHCLELLEKPRYACARTGVPAWEAPGASPKFTAPEGDLLCSWQHPPQSQVAILEEGQLCVPKVLMGKGVRLWEGGQV